MRTDLRAREKIAEPRAPEQLLGALQILRAHGRDFHAPAASTSARLLATSSSIDDVDVERRGGLAAAWAARGRVTPRDTVATVTGDARGPCPRWSVRKSALARARIEEAGIAIVGKPAVVVVIAAVERAIAIAPVVVVTGSD